MKTLICVAVLALVASAIASPAFNRAAINSLDQLAKIEGFFSSLKRIGGNALKGALNGAMGGGQIQKEDLVKIQTAMNQLAEIEGFWSSLKSIGGNALKGALNGAMGGGQIQKEDLAKIQAAMDQLAEIEGFWSSFKDIGGKALKGALNGAMGGGQIQQDDDDDDDDGDGDLNDAARRQGFFTNMLGGAIRGAVG